MTVLSMSPREEAFIISEANGTRSREVIALATAPTTDLLSGTVLATAAVDGNGNPTYAPVVLNGGAGDTIPTAVLIRSVRAGNTAAVIVARDAEVDASLLVWPSDTTDALKIGGAQQLAAVGIIVR